MEAGLSSFGIPVEAFDDGLSCGEFRVLAHLWRMRAEGGNRPSNREISEHCGLSMETVASSLQTLTQKPYWPFFTEAALTAEAVREMVISGSKAKRVCPWCTRRVVTLHRHHFPLPRKGGGSDVVKICGACHADFHHLFGS